MLFIIEVKFLILLKIIAQYLLRKEFVMSSISIRFPFIKTIDGGVFKPTKTTQESIRANLLSLLTTKKGQRVMRQRLYSPLYDYLWEPMDDFTKKEMRHALEEKIAEFIPDISLEEIDIEYINEQNLVRVTVVYTIDILGDIGDQATVFIPREEPEY